MSFHVKDPAHGAYLKQRSKAARGQKRKRGSATDVPDDAPFANGGEAA